MATRPMTRNESTTASGNPRRGVGRVLDSRWMLAVSVLAVLVAIAWALLERDPTSSAEPAVNPGEMARIELLGVPPGATVTLDGVEIDNALFGVTPGVRHALEVRDPSGRTWRQVFLANGSLSLVVELDEQFIEVPVDAATQ